MHPQIFCNKTLLDGFLSPSAAQFFSLPFICMHTEAIYWDNETPEWLFFDEICTSNEYWFFFHWWIQIVPQYENYIGASAML